MTDLLKEKLHEYLRDNNPDLLLELQESHSVTNYLEEKMLLTEGLTTQRLPDYIKEEHCMQVLTADLRPSKFHYIKNILEEEFVSVVFPQTEVINIIRHCKKLFQRYRFSQENEDSSELRYAIIGAIAEYLQA